MLAGINHPIPVVRKTVIWVILRYFTTLRQFDNSDITDINWLNGTDNVLDDNLFYARASWEKHHQHFGIKSFEHCL